MEEIFFILFYAFVKTLISVYHKQWNLLYANKKITRLLGNPRTECCLWHESNCIAKVWHYFTEETGKKRAELSLVNIVWLDTVKLNEK